MKILVTLSNFHSGGAERVAATLANAWATRGDRVTIVPTYSGGGKCFYPVSEKVRIVFLADLVGSRRKGLFNRLQRLAALRRVLVNEAPDVVVSFIPEVSVAAILAATRLGVPVIACERTDPVAWPAPAFLQWVIRLAYSQASMLTVQTEAVAHKIPAAFPRLKSLKVVPNPIPEELDRHRHRGEERARRRLVAFGRLSEEKRFDLLIAVFAAVEAHWPEWDLVIFGEGRLHGALERQIEALGLAKRIMLAGVTSSPWEEMARSDGFVMTSRVEGFPNALLEAMAVGLPCIAFDCPSGPREITRDGTDALLIPLNDTYGLACALEKLMGDAALRARLGAQARESVTRRFNLPAVIETWDRLFDEARDGQAGVRRGAESWSARNAR
ncbi:MAG: glycosyl transferase [Herminiimonas sp.]|nr:glycosyl transferase [Herminiimonas sp.]